MNMVLGYSVVYGLDGETARIDLDEDLPTVTPQAVSAVYISAVNEKEIHPFVRDFFEINGVRWICLMPFRVWIWRAPLIPWDRIIPKALDHIKRGMCADSMSELLPPTNGVGATASMTAPLL